MTSPASPVVRPDARRSLQQLAQEWVSCARCDLGKRRIEMQGRFVFGYGTPRSVMMIGEGPGADEEQEGLPFVGRSGQLLHKVLNHLQFKDVYFANTVCCRSCVQPVDQETGQPMFRKDRRTGISMPVYKDEPPTPPQCAACLPRLYEQIYMVDPIVIIGLGNKACETLMGKPVTITRDHGETAQISIPGAGYRPLVTKDQKWRRKIRGEVSDPVEQNEVRYHFIPTYHPAYVIRLLADQGPDNPFQQFVDDIKKAIRTYEEYLRMVFGGVPDRQIARTDAELQLQLQQE